MRVAVRSKMATPNSEPLSQDCFVYISFQEAYTRVLMGHIDLVTSHFRSGVYGNFNF